MTPLVTPSSRRRRPAALLLAGALLVGACGGDDPPASDRSSEDRSPDRAPPPTLAGGVELAAMDPIRLLVGDGIAYGEPLPSDQAAADAYLEDPEVASVVARRLYSRRDGRLLGHALVLSLDGSAIFDDTVLGAFVEGAVAALGDGNADLVPVAGRDVLRSLGPDRTAMGYLEGDQVLLVHGVHEQDVTVVLDRQVKAFTAGAAGAKEPFTPLVPTPAEAAYVAVPTITFQPIPPPEEEPVPPTPTMPGATSWQGRYGVVAGERRTTIWAYALDVPRTYPSAESVEGPLRTLVAERAGGADTGEQEVFGRIVIAADGPEGSPSARAFRYAGTVVLVEGLVPAQLDAVITAWLKELA